jgi:hypothetical protein
MPNDDKPSKKPYNGDIPITKEPDWNTFAIWYGLTTRGFRKRRKTKGVLIKEHFLSEDDCGEVFFKCGIPIRLPTELQTWAKELRDAWRR